MADAQNQPKVIGLKAKITWGDYKKLVSDDTPFAERMALIEKYVDCDDDTPFQDVMSTLRSALNPN